MELRQLKTLVAIEDYGSFAAAADAVGLTQSAVSLQIRHLEDELGVELFDRRRRSPAFNGKGRALVEHARKVVEICQHISQHSALEALEGTLMLGAVPTSLDGIVPPALASMREYHPRLLVKVASGLSAELTARTRSGDINTAVVTEPRHLADGLIAHQIAREPLIVIAPPEVEGESDQEILESRPFIQFDRRAWVGQQIDQHLKDRGIRVSLGMEINTLEAIARMVRCGLGVSVVPLPTGRETISAGLKWVSFGDPPLHRSLVVIERQANPQARLVSGLVGALRRVSKLEPVVT
jgi:DNA-binding transcriptional LysR family regulator